MSRLEAILSAILFLSVIFNVGIFVYARAAIRQLLTVSEELGDLQNMIDTFAKHLKVVYELETFYGDATLEHLLNHAVSLNEQLETFEYIYALTEEEGEELSEDEEEQEELLNDADKNTPPA
jgi:spore cortex formation protein SpoVR/YcgB (stage V sporulation)